MGERGQGGEQRLDCPERRGNTGRGRMGGSKERGLSSRTPCRGPEGYPGHGVTAGCWQCGWEVGRRWAGRN